MIGRRIYPDESGRMSFGPGDYGRDLSGLWHVRPPEGLLGILVDHEVTEHDDGTITVSPSIVGPDWHGYLERGIWRAA